MLRTCNQRMAFTNSTALVLILTIVALVNLCWFFLLPAKGEGHPLVKILMELEKTIKRSEDSEGGNWSILRKQIKRQQMNLALTPMNEYLTQDQITALRKVLDSLSYYIEGNWRLYEAGDDADTVKTLYKRSLKNIQEISSDKLNFSIVLDPINQETTKIDINDSVSELKNLIQDKLQTLEEQYDI
jgi:hypothetical protein